ncbi:MAG: hypothetical protein K2L99_07560 [Muribaculaceae bacterium]|nr:hypothetical protein [Muribaculaceae bacterium]
MKKIARYIACATVAACAMAATAQNTNSAYFLDNYTYRYQLNPAMGNDKGFVAMPGLGNLNVAMRGNLHLRDVLYNVDGRTCLFTNPGVGVQEAMDGFSNKNRLGVDLRENIISVGFKAFKGYNTVTLGARASASVAVPRALFSLAKEGATNDTYDIHNLGAAATGYAELALNHSHDIKAVPGLRVGASMKFLLPFAGVDARFHKAELALGTESWTAVTNADVYVNLPDFQFETDRNKQGREYVSGLNFDGTGGVKPQGFGMAFDLGATYKWRDFTFSAALLDLGWMGYTGSRYASTQGDRTVDTDAFTFDSDGDAPNSFSKEWDRLVDNIEDLYQMSDLGDGHSRTAAMHATLNLGADYELPSYRKLHFGLLSSTRLAGRYTWTEMRLSANVHPVKCFSAGLNFAAGTFGASFGWIANVHLTGFNFFVGMDHVPGKVAKQGAPLSSNASFNLGMNFPF